VTASPSQLIAKYRSLPFPSDALGDCTDNHTKTDILRCLDEYANDENVGLLLLDILHSPNEYDLARIEAAKIVGIYVSESSPLERRLKQQVTIFATQQM
jgi:hypothetical protein